MFVIFNNTLVEVVGIFFSCFSECLLSLKLRSALRRYSLGHLLQLLGKLCFLSSRVQCDAAFFISFPSFHLVRQISVSRHAEQPHLDDLQERETASMGVIVAICSNPTYNFCLKRVCKKWCVCLCGCVLVFVTY